VSPHTGTEISDLSKQILVMGPTKKIQCFGAAPKLSHLKRGTHGGFNVPQGSLHIGTEISPITAEMAEIYEVDRKLRSPPVVTVPTYRFSPYFATW